MQGDTLTSTSLEHETFFRWIQESVILFEAHVITFPAASLTTILLLLLLLQKSPRIAQAGSLSAHLRLVNASQELLPNTLFAFMNSLRTPFGR